MTANQLTDELMIQPNLKGTTAMLMHENLARVRMFEAERVAEEQRLAYRLCAVNRWRQMSGWASRRAARAVDQLTVG